MKIEWHTEKRKLGDLKVLENNPRKISDKDYQKLGEDIEEMGNFRPLIIDTENVILGGNQRYKQLLDKYGQDFEVEVSLPNRELSENERKKIIITDNTHRGDWDLDILGNEFDDILEDLEIDDLLPEVGFEVKEDNYEEPEDLETTVVLGDIYQLGEHRLMCGDSTKIEDVEKLMNGQKADMVFTDPPYGMKKENDGVANDNLNYDDLLEFNKKWIPITFNNLKDNGSWYCWGIDEPLMDIYSNILKPMAKKNKITFRNLITWNKFHKQKPTAIEMMRSYCIYDEKCLFVMCGTQGFNNNSENYFEGYEPIRKYLEEEAKKVKLDSKKLQEICGVGMYSHWFTKSQWDLMKEEYYLKLQNYYKNQAFKKEYQEIKKEYQEIKNKWYETRAYFNNTHETYMTEVWDFETTSGEERESAGGHATPKPIALCSRAIKSSSRENENVLDVFGGSGSTLIACEQTNRKCYMMEIDPHYCQVIIDRWEKFTGREAVKLN